MIVSYGSVFLPSEITIYIHGNPKLSLKAVRYENSFTNIKYDISSKTNIRKK